MWSQLQESEKREKVLKCELLSTQSALSDAQYQIEKLTNEVRQIDADRCRLIRFKASKVDRINELEEKVKKIDVFQNIDSEKLVNTLIKNES